MHNWQGFEIRTDGFSESLDRQIHLLAGVSGYALRKQAGEEIFALAKKLVRKCAAAGDTDSKLREILSWIQDLHIEELIWLIRAYTTFFHLINEAERQELIRKYREDALRENLENPIRYSLNNAFLHLKQQGMSSDQMLTLFGHLDIRPTLTPHPTEARRGSLLYKQKRISSLLSQLRFRNELSQGEQDDIITQIYRQIALMMVTDECRADHLSIEEEIRNSIHFCTTSIWETVPRIYADIQHAYDLYFNERCQIPVFLRYHSLIRGDRIANPAITPDTIRKTLISYRVAALKCYREGLKKLWEEFSISSRRLKVPKELCASLEKEAMCMSLGDNIHIRHRYEPYRMKISYMEQRIAQMIENPANMSYSCDAFLSDLLLLERCVESSGLEDVAACGLLSDLIFCVRTFGFHLMSSDICQQSSIHETVIHELLSIAGVSSNYNRMPEYEKILLLERELLNPRPLTSCHTTVSDSAHSVLKTFTVIREAFCKDRRTIGSYMVGQVSSVSDILEVLLLAKETGLWRIRNDKAESLINIVPMFETIADVEKAGQIMESLFINPVYALHLKAHQDSQEIMLNFAECAKDGGYCSAQWQIWKMQENIAKICSDHHVRFRMFHGAGSLVNQGGSFANHAIFAMPGSACNGRIRFTEPGEAISFRYGEAAIAKRHTEQVIHAVLTTMPENHEEISYTPEMIQLMEKISAYAMTGYRKLTKTSAFSEWYQNISEGLGRLPENFIFMQTRYRLSEWYGMGEGLKSLMSENTENLSVLRKMYASWHFFKELIDNAQRNMFQCRLAVAKCYTDSTDRRIHQQITEEFGKAVHAVSEITGQKELSEKEPAFWASVRFRSSWTDALNLIQIELLDRRKRAAEDEETGPVHNAIILTMNAISAAMQSLY